MATYWLLSTSRKEVDVYSAREDANDNGAQHISFNTIYRTEFVGDVVRGRK